MSLISVIVPVYNVEKYLDRCVSSIVNQTYRNLEIILVDDGSPDNCPAMCDAWAKKDSRIKVIHKQNGGVSSARNKGLDICNGSYACFVDSDDWIAPEFVELLLDAASRWSVPVAVCKMKLFHDASELSTPHIAQIQEAILSNRDAMECLVSGGVVQGGACDKLYHRSVFESVRFPEGYRHEDEFFTHNIMAKTENLVYIDAELYYYLQHENSFMHTSTMVHLDALAAYLERIELLREMYPDLHRACKVLFCISCINHCRSFVSERARSKSVFVKDLKHYRNMVQFDFKELIVCKPKELLSILFSKFAPMTFAGILNLFKGDIMK
jgi:glycosyltransferase involved in cell wall biosynthesis